jgi:hypothetical protein
MVNACEAVGAVRISMENRSTWRKPAPPVCPPKNAIWPRPEMNLGCHGGMLATNGPNFKWYRFKLHHTIFDKYNLKCCAITMSANVNTWNSDSYRIWLFMTSINFDFNFNNSLSTSIQKATKVQIFYRIHVVFHSPEKFLIKSYNFRLHVIILTFLDFEWYMFYFGLAMYFSFF